MDSQSLNRSGNDGSNDGVQPMPPAFSDLLDQEVDMAGGEFDEGTEFDELGRKDYV